MNFKTTALIMSVGLLLTNLHANQSTKGCHPCAKEKKHHKKVKPVCAPQVKELIRNTSVYRALYQTLKPTVSAISSLVYAIQLNSAAYPDLLAFANALAASVPTGRIIIADSNGVVIVDTNQGDLNTYDNYQNGLNPATFADAISINQMTNAAFIDSQIYPCGIGVETIFNSALGTTESYVVLRLKVIPNSVSTESYLNSLGSVSMSVETFSACIML
jgi:hypothetical protein